VTSRQRWLVASVAVLVGVVGLAAYSFEYHLHFRERTTVRGSDPQVVVSEQNGWGDAEVWGTVGYDPQTDCLYLDQLGRHADYPEAQDYRYGIAWPKGTRGVSRGERHGVRLGGYLGWIGGTVILAGDHVWLGGGYDGGPPRPPADCAGPDGWVVVAPGGMIADQPGPRPPRRAGR
jgi:hypothetical protein